MSERSQRVDPLGVCVHAVVERKWTDLGEATDTWLCVTCKAEFFHLDFSNHHAKIQVMEPYATLRDQFAMAAMTGMLGHHDLHSTIRNYPSADDWRKNIAEASYRWADVMMKARDQ